MGRSGVAKTFGSEVMMWTGPWTYQVTATYANGSRGSAVGSYTYPEPETPKGLTARQTARNTVMLSWQPVQNAAYYVVSGPPSTASMGSLYLVRNSFRNGFSPGR